MMIVRSGCGFITITTSMAESNVPQVEEQEEDAVPDEIEEQCVDCHHALGRVERLLKPLFATSHTAIHDNMSPLDNATLTLLITYMMNSMFWVYLNTRGVAPKTHPLKTELDRIQKYMQRASVITQRQKGEVPRVNKDAAKRFVRSALWEEGEDSSNKRRKEDSTSDDN